MTAAERGLLLLCCPLGEADAQVLTMLRLKCPRSPTKKNAQALWLTLLAVQTYS